MGIKNMDILTVLYKYIYHIINVFGNYNKMSGTV